MTKPTPSIKRIVDLQRLIVEFSRIERRLNFADTGRAENDVDHSFGLALTCWFIAPRMAPELDISKILMYALAHDIVEIHSGDTYIFDEAGVKTKAEREAAALTQLIKEWPDFPELTDAIQGYAEKRDAEARFVYTIDKMLPPLLINMGDGKKYFAENKITSEMHDAEKQTKMTQSPEALPYLDALTEWMHNPDNFYKND